MKTRDDIIQDAKRIKAEVEQVFMDAASWNDYSTARKRGCAPIDPDPYGELRRLLTAIDAFLAADTGDGPLPPIEFKRSH